MPSSDAYMELSDPAVWGETLDHQFGLSGRGLGAFEISQFSFDVSYPSPDDDKAGANQSGAAAPAKAKGKHDHPDIKTFSISKYIDRASPDLFLACCKKTKMDWALISVRESGEVSQKPYIVLEFQGLHVVSFKWDLDPADPEASNHIEKVDFDFETILIKYSKQEVTGLHVPVKMKGWNKKDNNETVSELQADLQAETAEAGN